MTALNGIMDQAKQVANVGMDSTDQSATRMATTAGREMSVLVGGLVVAALATLLVAWLVTRSITKPLLRISHILDGSAE